MKNLEFRFAKKGDEGLVLSFIKELAEYEKLSSEVVADEHAISTWIFDKNIAEVVFAMENGKEVGFALYFYSFSTFLGKIGIHLEDLFVKPEYRKRGYGKALIKEVARIAVERNAGRLEFTCLNWNKPSIDFYLSLGATKMDEWAIFRFSGESLKNLAK